MPGPIDLDFGAEETAAGDSTVTPPALTEEHVAYNGSLSAKTFGAFTDSDAIIASYSASIETNLGTASLGGSGLGPYSVSGATSGESGAITLNALDASANVVASAVHLISVGAEPGYTKWKQLLAADATAGSDPNTLATSFSASGDYNAFVGATHGTANAPQQFAQYEWSFVDPDTNAAIDWENGDFSGIEIWIQNDGVAYPDSAGKAAIYGIEETSNAAHGVIGGTYFDTARRIAAGNPTTVVGINYFTVGADPVFLIQGRMITMNGIDQVQVMDIHAVQFDNGTDQEYLRATQSAANQAHAANPTYKMKGYFSGNSNTKAYYRLVKKVVIPTP